VFQELIPLLNNATLVITMSGSAEALTLNVIPKPIDDKADAGLKTALTVTATAAELDAGLPEALYSYSASYVSMAQSVANAQAQMAEAEKDIKSANATKQAQASKARQAAAKAKPAPAPGNLFAAPTTSEDEECRMPEQLTAPPLILKGRP
jgi:PRTRC genetic system protein E